ncbi:MAG: polyphosphate kinase 2, partial [Bacteroidota bacterium]|nr:polyphosphate kinase 2 [Bacteroidota bacterium]
MSGLTKKNLKKLNSKRGLKLFLKDNDMTVAKALRILNYEAKLKKLQEELITMQQWVEAKGEKLIVIFEGRDAAGKGGAIRRITQNLNPREFDVVALPKPTPEEKSQWYFQRYIKNLPRSGQITFFDRSWYNRAVVEPVNGFCTTEEYTIFMNQVNDFEKMLVDSGVR